MSWLRHSAPISTLVALAATAVSCGSSGKFEPGPPTEDVKGTIVFAYGEAVSLEQVGEGWTDEIRLMNGDGSNKRTIARADDYSLNSPSWSPDGRKIVFVTGFTDPSLPPDGQLFVANADGSGQQVLSAHASDPAWSPDGGQIAFVRYAFRGGWAVAADLYLMNADGSGERRLARLSTERHPEAYGGLTAVRPEWAPRGTIVYQGRHGIYSIDADGSEKKQLTSSLDGNPSRSPDGSRLAFSRDVDGSSEVYVMSADGTGQHQVTRLGDVQVLGIDWSPDGSWIVFGANVDYGRCDIYLVKPDGSDLARLTTSGWNVEPAWRPARRSQ